MLHRLLSFESKAAQVTDTGDLVVSMSFASETPYERWWGIEVLDCSSQAVLLDRLNDGASLLFNHNLNDLRGVHVPGSVRADPDRVVRGDVRITSATQAGRDAIALVQSNVLTKTSVGYEIIDVIEKTTLKGRAVERAIPGVLFEGVRTRAEETARGDVRAFRRMLDERCGAFERAEDEPTTYIVTKWRPLENSLVTVPADVTVGVGRSAEEPHSDVRSVAAQQSPATPAIQPQGVHMDVKDNAPAGDIAGQHAISADNIRKLEQARAAGLAKLGEQNGIDAGVVRGWIEAGKTVNEAAGDVVAILEQRAKDDVLIGKLDMSKKEVQAYSMLRAIGAVCDKNWQHAGLELEAHKEMEKKLGRGCKSNNAFFVPFDVQARGIDMSDERIEREVARRMRYLGMGKRDLTVGTSNAGGYLVGTQNQGFIELLRNNTVLYALGARRLGGLTENLTIPRQVSGATPYWLSTEATAITESQMVLGQIALTPKTVGAYTEISRQLTLQSNPDVESLVMVDLASQVGIDIDAKGINGSGSSGQPTGLLQTSGLGSVTISSLALAGVIEFQSDVFGANANLANAGYLTTGVVAGALMARPRIASTDSVTLWRGALESGQLEGKLAMASNQMPTGYIVFGDFSEVVIAEWGVLEVDVNPFANFQAGIIGVRAISSIDVAVRQPGAFSVGSSFS